MELFGFSQDRNDVSSRAQAVVEYEELQLQTVASSKEKTVQDEQQHYQALEVVWSTRNVMQLYETGGLIQWLSPPSGLRSGLYFSVSEFFPWPIFVLITSHPPSRLLNSYVKLSCPKLSFVSISCLIATTLPLLHHSARWVNRSKTTLSIKTCHQECLCKLGLVAQLNKN